LPQQAPAVAMFTATMRRAAAAVERSALCLPTAVERMMANRPTTLRSGAARSEAAALTRQSYIIDLNLKLPGSLLDKAALWH